MRLTTAASSNFPLLWGRKRLASTPLVRDVGFLAIWEAQSRTATWVLLLAAASVGPWVAVLLMLPWGFAATHAYETARSRGLEDVMVSLRSHQGVRASKTLSWAIYGLKVYLLDYKQFLYAWLLGPLIRTPNTGWPQRQGRRLAIIAGLMLFGVTAAHHILRLAGFSEKGTYWGNMFARLLQIPIKLLETTLIVGAAVIVLRFLPFSGWL